MLSFPFHGRLSWASPSCAALFCAMLDSARLGPAAQVLQNWSNYPVLCHPADELITASACFPLNLEASKHNVLLALAHTNSSGKHTFLSLLHTNRQSCTHSHTAAVTYPAANKPNLAHSRKITVFLQTHQTNEDDAYYLLNWWSSKVALKTINYVINLIKCETAWKCVHFLFVFVLNRGITDVILNLSAYSLYAFIQRTANFELRAQLEMPLLSASTTTGSVHHPYLKTSTRVGWKTPCWATLPTL